MTNNNFTETSISDIAEIILGGTPKRANSNYWGYGIKWASAADIAACETRYIRKTKEEITHLGLKESNAKLLPKDTVVITARGTVGALCMLSEPMTFNQTCYGLLGSDYIEQSYLYFALKASIEKIKTQTYGAVFDTITIKSFENIRIPLPPLPIQRKVAAILSAYDDLIEKNTRRIQILEEMAQLIYREWFVHYRFPGHENVKMVDSGTEFGEIPEGWEVLPLSELVETQYGYTASAQNEPIGPKFLRGMDINKSSYIDWSSVPYCEIPDNVIDKFQLKIGDIVIIRMADPGKVGIIEQEVNAIFASYLVRLIIKTSRISPYFLFYFLYDEKYQGYITGASTGTTRKSASAGVLIGVDILCPSTKIMDEYNAQISSLRDLMNNLIMQNNNLRTTRDLLLPKLISGEIDVSELDIEIA